MATGMFRRRSALPFGAFLAVPGVLPLFLRQELWGSYLRLSGEASMELQRLRDVQLRVPNIKGPKGAAVGTRIREGLLRDNKVVPAVLATLALLVFAWLVVGAPYGMRLQRGVSKPGVPGPERGGAG